MIQIQSGVVRFRQDYQKPTTKVDKPQKIKREKIVYQPVMTKQKKFTEHAQLQGPGLKLFLCRLRPALP